MAVEKQRVIERFNPKFGTLSMPKLKLDAMSAKFALLIPDDATDEVIDSFLDTMNEAHPFKDIVADEHRKANPPKPTPTPANPAPADPPTPNPAPDAPKEDPILAAITRLTQEVQTLKSEKQQTTIQSKAKTLFSEKNVPEDYWGLASLPDKEEDLPAFVDGISGKYTAFQQTLSNSSIGGGRPAYGQPAKGSGKVDADIAAFKIQGTAKQN